MSNKIYYSDKYYDDDYEYRHVHVPKEIAAKIPKGRLMEEHEWRELGIQQSQGWIHYMVHGPEKHVVLFRRLRSDLPHGAAVAKGMESVYNSHATKV